MSLKEILDHFRAEGQTIKGAPFAFGSCLLICSVVIFLGIGWAEEWHYSGVISEKDATIAQKDETIRTVSEERDGVNRANEKLQHDNDWLRNYRAKDSLPLKQSALNLARQIHEYIKDWKDTDPPDLQYDNVQKYLRRFGMRASLMRDDLDQYGQDSTNLDRIMWNFQQTYGEVRIIADETERLANNLPDQ